MKMNHSISGTFGHGEISIKVVMISRCLKAHLECLSQLCFPRLVRMNCVMLSVSKDCSHPASALNVSMSGSLGVSLRPCFFVSKNPWPTEGPKAKK